MDEDVVRRYHQRTVHHPGRFAHGPGFVDWASEPNPFRVFEGAPVVELPVAAEGGPSWSDLHRWGAVPPQRLDRSSLGAFFELALGVTAWKQAGISRWALRANPSSGNLHPTEGYALLPEAPGVPAGVYHYRSVDHVLERRWSPDETAASRLASWLAGGAFVAGLSSIAWREAWKYGERAFRYCQLDVGHALAAIAYAAAVHGWGARLLDGASDADVATVLGVSRGEDFSRVVDADREQAEALVLIGPPAALDAALGRSPQGLDEAVVGMRRGRWTGSANPLGPSHVAWPEIDAVTAATRKPRSTTSPPASREVQGGLDPSERSASGLPRAVKLIRQRRSAVAMDGATSLPLNAFLITLQRLLPRCDQPPWGLLADSPRVHPVLFIHRVEGVRPGLAILEREPGAGVDLRAALRASFTWARAEGVPGDIPLYVLEEGDSRDLAGMASCGQSIASDSAFAVAMIAAFDEALEVGAWRYRSLFWEAGMLGHVLYLEAEAAGLRGTGMGCYFDDVVHETLGLATDRFRDLYHFTVGGPVDDPRLATSPAYPEDVRLRPRPR